MIFDEKRNLRVLKGGDEKLLTGEHKFPSAAAQAELTAEKEGYITATNSEAVDMLAGGYCLGDKKPPYKPLIYKVID